MSETLPEIMTEAAWLACVEPSDLRDHVYFRYGRESDRHDLMHWHEGFDPQRFRWLAVAWGRRIRHLFDANDLAWFDAFTAWVGGVGEHPLRCNVPPALYPLDYPKSEVRYARLCAWAIRRDDSMDAAVCAAVSASMDLQRPRPDSPDFTKTHRRRAKSSREAERVKQWVEIQEWLAVEKRHQDRIRREFCDQFRDVAGNPFRPVTFDPARRTPAVMGLARDIDVEAAFDRLPILADALEEAGCESADILGHCRGPGPHVRGCWVIDTLLGRM